MTVDTFSEKRIHAMREFVLDQPGILRALFHPRPEYGFAVSHQGIHSVKVEVEPNIFIGGRLYPASEQAPAILFFHGNGEIAADYDHLFRLYVERDITLLVVDYRGYGASNGTPTVTNLMTDAIALSKATDTIFAQHHLSPARLYVMGRSLGSAPAIEIAVESPKNQIAGLIIESGFANTLVLLNRLGVVIHAHIPDKYNNVSKMSQMTLPLLVIHGENDVLIPASEGYELYQRAATTHKQLALIPGAGHNDLMMLGMFQYFEAIEQFIGSDR